MAGVLGGARLLTLRQRDCVWIGPFRSGIGSREGENSGYDRGDKKRMHSDKKFRVGGIAIELWPNFGFLFK